MFLAIDYGTKRIGLAGGKIIPRGFGVLDGSLPEGHIIEKITEICQQNEIEAIVLGWPVRSQGEDGSLASRIRQFGQKIETSSGLPLYYEPEQYTSVEANDMIKKYDKAGKSQVDEIAAIILLEQFLNNRKSWDK